MESGHVEFVVSPVCRATWAGRWRLLQGLRRCRFIRRR